MTAFATKVDGNILFAKEYNLLYPYMFGNGADGAFSSSSGTTNLLAGKVYNYTSFSLTGTGVITISASANTAPLIILVQGNCTISSSGTSINLKGKGLAAGSGGTNDVGLAGDGNYSFYPLFGPVFSRTNSSGTISPAPYHSLTGGGTGGAGGRAGGGGAGWAASGSNGSDSGAGTGGANTVITPTNPSSIMLLNGAGGGGGSGAGGGGVGGAGGNGGCSLILIVGGDLVFSGTIDVTGNAGSNAVSGTAGGGGGGGGGLSFVQCFGTLTNSGTITVTAAAGGTGLGGAGTGGSGGAGLSVISALA